MSMTSKLAKKSIAEIAPLIKNKEISPVDVIESVFSQIRNKNNILNAYIDIYEDEAYQHAIQVEREIVKGKYRGSLHGIPIGLKDNLFLKDKRTTIGSKIHKDFKPEYDATVVKKLKEQGVIFTGKLNLDEYAYGVTTENPHYGTSRNPWDPNKITGGSSGGSVSAVGSHMSMASIGSETGGSLRAPGSFCGLVSIKPTFGRVSKYGCYPLAPSLDHVGPIAKTVDDVALILQNIAGYDRSDPISSNCTVDNYTAELEKDVKELVIGVNEDYFFHNIDPDVESNVKQTINKLEQLGAKVQEINFKKINDARYAYAMTIAAEASAVHHEHLKNRSDDLGDLIRSELYFGETLSAVDYLHAQNIREQVRRDFQNIFKKVDVLIAPTVPFVAPSIGQQNIMLNGKEVPFSAHVSRLIRPTTLIGLPAITVPCGMSQGLPIGIQILSAPFKESTILKVAKKIENMNLI